MPVIHIIGAPWSFNDGDSTRVARAAAEAAGLGPEQVLVDRVDARVLDGNGRPAEWASVLIQGADRGQQVTDAVVEAVRTAWPDRSVSIAWVFDVGV